GSRSLHLISASPPKIYLISAEHLRKRRELRWGGDLLMPNVFRRNGVNGVLGNVSSMIAHPSEVARDKHQIDVTAQLFRIARHPIDQLPAHLGVHFIKGVVL